jgi:hypothetical protein
MDRKLVIAVVVSLAVGASVGRFSVGSKVVKTEEVQEHQVATRARDTVKHDNVETVVTVTQDCSSGKKVVVTRTVDLSTVETKAAARTETAIEEKKSEIVERSHGELHVMVIAGKKWDAPALSPGVLLEKRLLGPVWFGAFALTSGTVGAGLGLEF